MMPTFRGRAPRPLAFGTSGLRGLVEDITDLETWVNTRGYLQFVREASLPEGERQLAIAGDLRPSTPRILRAVRRAALDAGFEVIECGSIPTPALALFAFSRGLPSAMVTGSHIPFDRNGIKFNRPRGEVLKVDEPAILARVEDARREAYAEDPGRSIFDDDGMLRPHAYPPDPLADGRARAEYLERYLGFFTEGALRGLRVAVDQHSAVGRDLLVEVLGTLGAQVQAVGRSDRFVAVDTEAVDDEMLAAIAERAAPARAALGGLDAVVSTDGDSDRPLLVVFDGADRPIFVRGDTLGAMVAEDLDADAVAVPVSASDLVDRHLAHRGVSIQRTRIGSPWVIEAMSAQDGVRKMGFEANGGFLLETEIERSGRRLACLPTRDAFLPLLTVLGRAAERREALHERLARLPQRFTTAGLVDAVPRSVALAALAPIFVEGLAEAWMAGSETRFRRPQEHPRSADAQMQETLRQVVERIHRRFQPHGLQGVLHINWVDGIRVSFEGGDVLHLRASGNAPQLRLYATADTMARAQELVATGLGPAGPVTRMLEEARRGVVA